MKQTQIETGLFDSLGVFYKAISKVLLEKARIESENRKKIGKLKDSII